MLGTSLGCQAGVVLMCLCFRAKWPMHAKLLREVVSSCGNILEMMQNSFTVITKLRLKKIGITKQDLENMVEELTETYNKAFEKEHPFQYTVLELIDELKDTSTIINDRKQKQDYHFLADFLEIIDDKKSYL
mmetsp:Transcript_32381/g.36917  ORF Transcript_32381/g.36917 Transcript_32381/m.36917 type:complete len:132 (-) Transcript_32381:13-408(-)